MSRQRQKGTAAETAVVQTLRSNGWIHAERRALHGQVDKGDILLGDPSVVIEVKSHKDFDLAGWVKEANQERDNAGASVGVVWAKRRGTTNPLEWYGIVDGATLVKLLRAWCGL